MPARVPLSNGLWPASTGWLIVSILFANKLWLIDVTSVSLYWVARLPIEWPKATSPLEPTQLRQGTEPSRLPHAAAPVRRKRQWKLALSLAILGALITPFGSQTYKLSRVHSVWVPLTGPEKLELAFSLKHSNYCESYNGTTVADFLCETEKRKLQEGGDYKYYSDDLSYVALNVGASVAGFIIIFALTLLLPMFARGIAYIFRMYWVWLNR